MPDNINIICRGRGCSEGSKAIWLMIKEVNLPVLPHGASQNSSPLTGEDTGGGDQILSPSPSSPPIPSTGSGQAREGII